MKREDWMRLAEAVNADIAGIARAERTRSEVHKEISHRAAHKTEEQFIDERCFDQPSGEGRIHIIEGKRVKVWKIHRYGLQCRDVKGADLVYEMLPKKYVLVQYKKAGNNGSVKLDQGQLATLKDACPVNCEPSERFRCGAWYAVISDTRLQYFPACEARKVFQTYASRNARSFINGLTEEQFQRDFAACHIGARTQLIDLGSYEESSMQEDKMLVHAKELD